MEFRYKKTNLHILAFIVGVIMLLSSITWFITLFIQYGKPPSNIDFIYISVLFFTPAYYGFKFYHSEQNALITLNEIEISYVLESKIIKIPWADVNKVYFRESTKKIGVTSILVEGENKEIFIGSRIENFPEIIKFVKAKVGEKFNTFDIPLELKM